MRMLTADRRRRSGVTLIELIVAIAVIGLLVAIVAPAIQSLRELARKMQCGNNLHQMSVALAQYHDVYGTLPPTLISSNDPFCGCENPITAMFLFWGAKSKCENVHAEIRHIRVLECPSDGDVSSLDFPMSYVVNASPGWNTGSLLKGPFDYTHPLNGTRLGDVTDGLSSTASISEDIVIRAGGTTAVADRESKRYWFQVVVPNVSRTTIDFPTTLAALAEREAQTSLSISDCVGTLRTHTYSDISIIGNWRRPNTNITSYTHWLPPNAPVCNAEGRGADRPFINDGHRAASDHRRGVNVAYLDGHVAFMNENVDKSLWRALGTINGAETIAGSIGP